MKQNLVTVVIPTTAEKSREKQIKRAINSVRSSSVDPIRIIVVVNGDRFDEVNCLWLKSQSDISYEYLSKPSLPNAILHARGMVKTPFFATLDDDDEYLPGAIDMRLSVINESPDIDMVVTNGFIQKDGKKEMFISCIENAALMPLTSLFEATWLCSNNALYRSSSISVNYFKHYHPYAEWTWLAYQIAFDDKKIAVLNQPTFCCYDTPGSLSKSQQYKDAYFSLFQRMLDKNPPQKIKNLIRRKVSAAYHDRSDNELNAGNYKNALLFHTKSLLLPGGMRYLLYSRKFFKLKRSRYL